MIDETSPAAGVSTAQGQLHWAVSASARNPLPDNEIRQHVATVLLDAVGGPEAFNTVLAQFGALFVRDTLVARAEFAQAVVSGCIDYVLTIGIDDRGLISTAQLTPDEAPPTSWDAIDVQLQTFCAQTSFAAAEIDPAGQVRLVHGLGADTRRPIGSAFKLYVLGTLGQAVTEGRVAWADRLAIRDEWKSLPSGTLQNQPAGAELPLTIYADQMIAISDNTATDHLIHHLGRAAVQHQLSLFGHSDPWANTPFPSTKAFFQFKVTDDTTRAEHYLALPRGERLGALVEVERLPLPEVKGMWPQPKYLDDIEWFASPLDICRAYAGLLSLDQPEIDHALTRNDGGLSLNAARFPTVFYKGGSEPGLVTLHYLVRTADERTLACSLMTSDPETTLDTVAVALAQQTIVRGAFQLMSTPD